MRSSSRLSGRSRAELLAGGERSREDADGTLRDI